MGVWGKGTCKVAWFLNKRVNCKTRHQQKTRGQERKHTPNETPASDSHIWSLVVESGACSLRVREGMPRSGAQISCYQTAREFKEMHSLGVRGIRGAQCGGTRIADTPQRHRWHLGENATTPHTDVTPSHLQPRNNGESKGRGHTCFSNLSPGVLKGVWTQVRRRSAPACGSPLVLAVDKHSHKGTWHAGANPASALRPLSPGRARQGRAGPGWAGRVRARAPGGAALPISDKGRPADHVVRREEVRLVFPTGLWSGGCGAMRGYPGVDGCEPR